MAETQSALMRFRLRWRDGVVREIVAADLDEAIVRCGKGEPWSHSLVWEDNTDWINIQVSPLARGEELDWVCPDGTALRFKMVMGVNGLSILAYKLTKERPTIS